MIAFDLAATFRVARSTEYQFDSHLDKKMDAVIIAVAHVPFWKVSVKQIRSLMNDKPVAGGPGCSGEVGDVLP